MTNDTPIGKQRVKLAVAGEPKDIDTIADQLGLRCDMGEVHHRDEIAATLRELHRDGEVTTTLDRRWELNHD